MAIFIWLGTFLAWDGMLTDGVTLEPVPETTGHYLQQPGSLAIDKQGRFYVLDLRSRVVFVWRPDGRFLSHFGQKGEGPGEFSFGSDDYPLGDILVSDNRVLVFDGAKKLLHHFDLDFHYLKTDLVPISGYRIVYLGLTRNGGFVFLQDHFEDTPMRKVFLYDSSFKMIGKLKETANRSYEPKIENGKLVGYTIHAYVPRLNTHSNPTNDEILVCTPDQPQFEVFDMKGGLKRRVRFHFPRRETTQEDKDEFLKLGWLQGKEDYYQVKFPDKLPYYNLVLPYQNLGYLVFHLSEISRKVDGILIDRDGKTLEKVRFECGENGAPFGDRGRVVAIMTDQNGEFEIKEILFEGLAR